MILLLIDYSGFKLSYGEGLRPELWSLVGILCIDINFTTLCHTGWFKLVLLSITNEERKHC